MSYLLMFAIIGLGNFILRYSFFYLFGKVEISPMVVRILSYIPPTALAAIVAPAVFKTNGSLDISLGNLQLYAAAIAFVVAYYTRNMLLTILTGMAALILLKTVF
jgi:branched-subunit amino acid transport protein